MHQLTHSELKIFVKDRMASFANESGFVLSKNKSLRGQDVYFQRNQEYGWDGLYMGITLNSIAVGGIYQRFDEVESLFCLDGIACKQKEIYCTEYNHTFTYPAKETELPLNHFNSWDDAEAYMVAVLDWLKEKRLPQTAQMNSVPALFQHIELGPDAFGKEWLWQDCGLHPSLSSAYLAKVLIISKLCGDPKFEQKVQIILQKYEPMLNDPGYRMSFEHLQTSIQTIRSIERKYQIS
jgi:hypothetical protein